MEYTSQKRLSFGEKAGYSLGDMAANLVFQALMYYQFTFFIGVMGLSPFAAGTLFLIGRFFDAFTDPMMGFIADRTKTKWGRFRPWLIWSALPFAGIFWLTFTSPGWEPTAQLVYAYIMYFLLMAVYTVNNVPYCSLNGVMTADVDERTSLSTFRFVGMTVAQLLVFGFTLPLVSKLGGGDDAKGWSLTMGIFAALTIVLFLVAFISVKERVQPDPKQKSSPKQDMLDTFKNKPWVILFSATLMIFIMLVVRGSSLAPYMQNYVSAEALTKFFTDWGFVTPVDGVLTPIQKALDFIGFLIQSDLSNANNVAFGVFNLIGIPTTLIGVLLSKPLSMTFGKRTVFVTCLILTALSTCWLFFIKGDDINSMFLQSVSWGLCYGPTIPLLWSMIADAADFSEWKTGRRATGFTFAGVVFALKFGLGIGGFIQAGILGLYGYNPEALTDKAILGVRMVTTFYPAIFIIVAAAILLFYPISNKLNHQIANELEERRKSFGKTPA